MPRPLRSLCYCIALVLAGLTSSAWALEFRSVDEAGAILYDAPSKKGAKLFVVRRFTPVEVVVNLEGWAKVRDAEGTMAWIEKKALTDKRMVIVTAARAKLRPNPEASASPLLEAEKNVAFELIGPPRPAGPRYATRMGSRATCAPTKSGACKRRLAAAWPSPT